MIELREAGVEIRVFKPRFQGHGFASLHAKTWILDDSLALSGSVNTTDCGMQGNKEHMFVISQQEAVVKLLADFEGLWSVADPLSQEVLEKLASGYHSKMQERAERRSRSKSVQRELPKRPQQALEDAVDAADPSAGTTLGI